MEGLFGGPKTKKIPGIENGWFSETENMWPGQKFSLALEEFSEQKSVLFHQESEFQSILVFQSAQYGNVLVLDGVLQSTEKDEFAYHEMMVHVPMFSHPNPKHVLIVGGGDGCALREVCRHEQVKQITLVEIDPLVIEVSKKYMLNDEEDVAIFDDPRVDIVHADAAEFLKNPEHAGKYDVIIADTSDPVGPAGSLINPEFFDTAERVLKDGGVFCIQAECFWINLELVSDLVGCCADIFDYAEYATTMLPSYPCGQIGFVLARKGVSKSCKVPVHKKKFQTKWYNADVHQAAFVLPQFVKEALEDLNKANEEEEGDRCVLSQCTIM